MTNCSQIDFISQFEILDGSFYFFLKPKRVQILGNQMATLCPFLENIIFYLPGKVGSLASCGDSNCSSNASCGLLFFGLFVFYFLGFFWFGHSLGRGGVREREGERERRVEENLPLVSRYKTNSVCLQIWLYIAKLATINYSATSTF